MIESMNVMLQERKGFTIVELLIVIVVIGILAAITIVAYNGIQSRARDSKRTSDLTSIKKALELYHVDKGGYPLCSSPTPYTPGGTSEGCLVDGNVKTALVPAYLSSMPTPPSGSSYCGGYFYAIGYKKSSEVAASANNTDNYIIGTTLEAKTSPAGNLWGCGVTYVDGSAN